MASVRYKRAVGLRYTRGTDEAPVLQLVTEDVLADRTVKLARRFGIPIIERPELAQALSSCELDDAIPPELFEAVAIILAELERDKRLNS